MQHFLRFIRNDGQQLEVIRTISCHFAIDIMFRLDFPIAIELGMNFGENVLVSIRNYD